MTRWAWFWVTTLAGGSALSAPGGEWLSPTSGATSGMPLASDIDAEASRLRRLLRALAREAEERQALTIARGRVYVRLARAGLLPLGDGFDALANHASRLERLRRAVDRDLRRQAQIVSERLETAKALSALDELRPSARIAQQRAQAAIAAAEERDAAFRRAFESNWQPRGHSAVYGALPARQGVASHAGFRERKGRLPFPLAGRVEMQNVQSPTGRGRALVMKSPLGSPVRSVHAGRVAYADEYPGWGRTVIVDHGAQLYTVSSHLARISVQAGDELSPGQTIGSVGYYEQSPGLLFEVRSGQATLDTPKWFGL